MSFIEITSNNYSDCINQLKSDLNQYEEKFESIEKESVELECKYQRDKYDLRDLFSNLNESVSMEILSLYKIGLFVFDKEIFQCELKLSLSNYSTVLRNSEDILKEICLHNEEINRIETDVCYEEENYRIPPQAAVVRPYLVHSRQTSQPFILSSMQPGKRNLCNGCKQKIPLRFPYLKHREEYPAGSKQLIPHGYHIEPKCFFDRGFEKSYLNSIKVLCEETIDDYITKALLDIGFVTKNILTKNGEDSDLSDNLSQCSSTSFESSRMIAFILKRQSFNNKSRLICFSCCQEIVSDTYLSYGNSLDQLMHINPNCVKAMTKDLGPVKCRVFKILKVYAELTKLVECGFQYKNIIGFKPSNLNYKGKLSHQLLSSFNPPKRAFKDLSFLFNTEPFACERLIHGETCQGCQDRLQRADMCLRHKEQVPREKLKEAPLISQFYHCAKKCLIERGFTEQYIGESPSIVSLSGQDNVQEIGNMLAACGFSVHKLTFYTTYDNNQSYKPVPVHGLKEPRFVVEYSVDNIGDCCSCGMSLHLDTFVLKVVFDNGDNLVTSVCMHLAVNCVTKGGSVTQGFRCNRLDASVPLTALARKRLEECGFRNIPF